MMRSNRINRTVRTAPDGSLYFEYFIDTPIDIDTRDPSGVKHLFNTVWGEMFGHADGAYAIYDPERKMFWKPYRSGYTPDMLEIGCFSYKEAKEITTQVNVSDVMIPMKYVRLLF